MLLLLLLLLLQLQLRRVRPQHHLPVWLVPGRHGGVSADVGGRRGEGREEEQGGVHAHGPVGEGLGAAAARREELLQQRKARMFF